MKKTKKIVSTILGLLSAFSFKSSAMDFDIDDDEDDALHTYNIDGELDNQKGISLGDKTLGTIIGSGLLLLLSKYYNENSFEQILIDKNGEKCLQEFKNNDKLREAKENEMRENASYFLMKCSDKIVKRICGYFTFVNVMVQLYDNRSLNTPDKTKKFIEAFIETLTPIAVSTQVIKDCNALELNSEGDVAEYTYLAAISVIRSFFDEKVLSISDGKLTANREDFGSIVNTCFLRLEKYVDDKENEIKKNYEKDKQGPVNGEIKKFYSWMACCLGADLWKKLYPNKEYDEEEYLRLQKELCTM